MSIYWGFMLLREQELWTCHRFPKENSRAKDIVLWERILRSLAGGRDTMPIQLNPCLKKPHISYHWFTDETASVLYRRRVQVLGEMYDTFTLQMMTRLTRLGQRYE